MDAAPKRSVYRGSRIGLLVGAVLALGFLQGHRASAQDLDLTVRVTITEVQALEDFEGGGSADWYSYVTIAGHEQGNEDTSETDSVENTDHIFVSWEFDRAVNLAQGSIPVMIEIRDEDGGLRLGDDLADIDPDVDAVFLDFDVHLASCTVSGEVNGSCGQVFSSAGNDPADSSSDGRAKVHFKVEVFGLPAEAPETLVRCTHRPIWPDPGDTVEVMVESLNGELDPRISDTVEIWLGASLLVGKADRTRLTATFQTTAESFVYGCKLFDTPVSNEDEPAVFSGWRRVQQGDPPMGRAVPVLFNEPRPAGIDFVFIPDTDSYPTGADDPTFTDGVESSVYDPDLGLYSEKVYLQRQHLLNIWLARDEGDADPDTLDADDDGQTDDCLYPLTPPANFDTDYLFAEAGAILHTDIFRDCAHDRLFSTEPPNINLTRTVVHESGHRPFGLADEYCCDGGYFELTDAPNLYREPEGCADDAPNVGRSAVDCRAFSDDKNRDWFTSDPPDDDNSTPDDDMMDDRGPAQALDLRRINWMLDQCEEVPPQC